LLETGVWALAGCMGRRWYLSGGADVSPVMQGGCFYGRPAWARAAKMTP